MRVNVIGSGYMGKQISSLLAIIGFDVLIWQKNNSNLKDDINKEIKKIGKILKIKSSGSIEITSDLKKLENYLTIETVIESLKIKKEIFETLNYKKNLFSNTSSIKLSSIGTNINGLHFMNPVTIKLIELCKIGNFDENKLNHIITELKKISYEILNVADSPGFFVNKILFKDISFFFYLLEKEKKKIEEINKIFAERKLSDNLKKEFRKTDPLKLINRIGVDTCLNILINLNKYDNQYYVPKMLKDSVDLKVLGNKNKTQFKIL